MLCGLPAIIIYSLVAEGNPLTFQLDMESDRLCTLSDHRRHDRGVLALLLAFDKIESTKAMMISLVTPLLAVVIGGSYSAKSCRRKPALAAC